MYQITWWIVALNSHFTHIYFIDIIAPRSLSFLIYISDSQPFDAVAFYNDYESRPQPLLWESRQPQSRTIVFVFQATP